MNLALHQQGDAICDLSGHGLEVAADDVAQGLHAGHVGQHQSDQQGHAAHQHDRYDNSPAYGMAHDLPTQNEGYSKQPVGANSRAARGVDQWESDRLATQVDDASD